MPNAAPIGQKRVTETHCLCYAIISAAAMLFYLYIAIDSIWHHKYGPAAGSTGAASIAVDRLRFWLAYRNALRFANPAALPFTSGHITLYQEPLTLGSTQTRTIAFEELPRVSRIFTILITLIALLIVAMAALALYINRLRYPWVSLSILAVAAAFTFWTITLWRRIRLQHRPANIVVHNPAAPTE